jgi:hypothetical protein
VRCDGEASVRSDADIVAGDHGVEGKCSITAGSAFIAANGSRSASIHVRSRRREVSIMTPKVAG